MLPKATATQLAVIAAVMATVGFPVPADAGRTSEQLPKLPVAPEDRGGYDRDSWGGWQKGIADSCLDTRGYVLAQTSEVRPVIRNGKNGCFVAEGRWTDPYSGQVFTKPSDLDVDHVVAVQEANDSGAKRWSIDRKKIFYNDPDNLWPTARQINREKGAKGPEEWMPPKPEARCRFVVRWVEIKTRYGLMADRIERAAVDDALQTYCP